MDNSNVCIFIPTLGIHDELNALNFVAEKNWHETKTEICGAFKMNIVTKGKAIFRMFGKEYQLSAGDLFFVFQAKEYQILNTDSLEFLYITFIGTRTKSLFARLGVTNENFVFHNFGHCEDFWRASLARNDSGNIDLVAQSVLYYTFSHLESRLSEEKKKTPPKNMMLEIKEYIDNNYRNPKLSLSFLSSKFGYTTGYISESFRKTAGINISSYITKLRMEYALEIISEGFTVVSLISEACGYSDPLYFSKVFKSFYGVSPKAKMNGTQGGFPDTSR